MSIEFSVVWNLLFQCHELVTAVTPQSLCDWSRTEGELRDVLAYVLNDLQQLRIISDCMVFQSVSRWCGMECKRMCKARQSTVQLKSTDQSRLPSWIWSIDQWLIVSIREWNYQFCLAMILNTSALVNSGGEGKSSQITLTIAHVTSIWLYVAPSVPHLLWLTTSSDCRKFASELVLLYLSLGLHLRKKGTNKK